MSRQETVGKSLKLSVAMIVAVIVALTAAFVFARSGEDEPAASSDGASEPFVRDDSPRLSSGEDAVLVEFLDFECEACLAAHPTIKELRSTYGEDVTFVVRYLPLHGNSMNAAVAADAARMQGKFEEMHDKLFESATEWGHQQTSQAKVFEGYAEEIGLDMEQYRKDIADPKTTARVEQSAEDAKTLGVQGTPTFFLDGEKLEAGTPDDLRKALDDAVKD